MRDVFIECALENDSLAALLSADAKCQQKLFTEDAWCVEGYCTRVDKGRQHVSCGLDPDEPEDHCQRQYHDEHALCDSSTNQCNVSCQNEHLPASYANVSDAPNKFCDDRFSRTLCDENTHTCKPPVVKPYVALVIVDKTTSDQGCSQDKINNQPAPGTDLVAAELHKNLGDPNLIYGTLEHVTFGSPNLPNSFTMTSIIDGQPPSLDLQTECPANLGPDNIVSIGCGGVGIFTFHDAQGNLEALKHDMAILVRSHDDYCPGHATPGTNNNQYEPLICKDIQAVQGGDFTDCYSGLYFEDAVAVGTYDIGCDRGMGKRVHAVS